MHMLFIEINLISEKKVLPISLHGTRGNLRIRKSSFSEAKKILKYSGFGTYKCSLSVNHV